MTSSEENVMLLHVIGLSKTQTNYQIACNMTFSSLDVINSKGLLVFSVYGCAMTTVISCIISCFLQIADIANPYHVKHSRMRVSHLDLVLILKVSEVLKTYKQTKLLVIVVCMCTRNVLVLTRRNISQSFLFFIHVLVEC